MKNVTLSGLLLTLLLLVSFDIQAQITISHTITQPSYCYYGNGLMDFSGLTPSTTYQLHYTKNGTVQPVVNITSTTLGTYELINVAPGTYTNIYMTKGASTSNILGPDVFNTPPTPTINIVSHQYVSYCNANDGWIKIGGLTPNATYTFSYTKNGGTVINSALIGADATGNYTVTGLGMGTYDNFNFKSSTTGCISSSVGPDILLDTPPKEILLSSVGTCNNQGVISLYNGTKNVNFTVNYNLSGVPQSPVSATTNIDGFLSFGGNLVPGSYDNIMIKRSGCTTLSAPQSINVPLIVDAPTIGYSFISPTQCYYSNGSITINGMTHNTGYSLVFTRNGIQQSTGINADASGVGVYDHIDAGVYNNMYVERFGCVSTNILGPFTVTIPVTGSINVQSVISPSTCNVSNGVIKISGLTPNSTYTYSYNKGVASVYNSALIAVDATGVYNITGLNEGEYDNLQFKPSSTGCPSPAISQVNLTSSPTISSVFTSMAAICGDSTGKITLNGLYPTATYRVYYQKNGDAHLAEGLVANNAGSVTIPNLGPGVYSQITASPVGCANYSSAVGPVTITATATQGLILTPTPGNSIVAGDSVTFVAVASNTGLATSYHWKKNSTNLSSTGSTYIAHNLINGDTISCTVSSYICGVLTSTSSSVIMNVTAAKHDNNNQGTTGIDKLSVENDIKLYPNPTSSILFIDSKVPVNIKVTDIMGKVVKEMPQDKYIDMSRLVSGIYLVHLYNDTGLLLHVERVVKE